jgi:branched-chain amino acid transport system permease protein
MLKFADIDRRRAAFFLVCGAVLLLVPFLGASFYTQFAARVLIYGLAAMSLGLILGYGGMVSFGHSAFLGVGAYTVGMLAVEGIMSAWISWPAAILASAAVAGVIGALSLRTRGIYFIMITLAFSQMLYYLTLSFERYGGDDGKRLPGRNTLGGFIDLGNETTFYYVTLAVVAVCLVFLTRVVNSRLGMVLLGAASNERRMAAIGIPTYRYKLVAFVIAGTMAGLAGALLANLNLYFSPRYIEWIISGELIVMVILGGIGTLAGPVLGAALFMVISEVLAHFTVHWMLGFGPLLLLVVLFANRGVYGWIAARSDKA